MEAAIVAAALIGGLVVGPLAWRIWEDRRTERALCVRAWAHASIVRALGGESLVSINVRPPAPWHPGRIELSAPRDWQFLLESAAAALVRRVPADYELVLRAVEVVGAQHPEVARAA